MYAYFDALYYHNYYQTSKSKCEKWQFLKLKKIIIIYTGKYWIDTSWSVSLKCTTVITYYIKSSISIICKYELIYRNTPRDIVFCYTYCKIHSVYSHLWPYLNVLWNKKNKTNFNAKNYEINCTRACLFKIDGALYFSKYVENTIFFFFLNSYLE